jgi:hypothetical protein
MKNKNMGKGVVFCIILLFIGTSMVPGISESIKEEYDDVHYEHLSTAKQLVVADRFEPYVEMSQSMELSFSNNKALSGSSENYHNLLRDNYVTSNSGDREVVWQWAVSAGGSSTDIGYGVAVDSSGNAYITGYFRGSASFGPFTLTSAGSADVFVAKLSENGGGNQPDLTVTDIIIPNYMVENQHYTIKATIQNIGTAPAEYNFKIQFLHMGPYDSNWTILSTQNIYQLNPGQTITRQTTWTPNIAGTHLFKVITDVYDDIPESNEDNNHMITSGLVLPTIQNYPSVNYNSDTQTVNINAKFYNTIQKIYIKTGTATWGIYDQAGTLFLTGQLTFNTGMDQWRAHNIYVGSLNNGELYTVKFSWGSYILYETIDFLKTSGYCVVEGYVRNRATNYPIAGAIVRLYYPWYTFIFGMPPKATALTNSQGYYSFGTISAQSTTFSMLSVTSSNYIPRTHALITESDTIHEINFLLTDNNEDIFPHLLTPLETSIHNTMDGTVTKAISMNHNLYGILNPDPEEQWLWEALDIAGSVMVSGAKDMGTVKQLATSTFRQTLQETLKQAAVNKLAEKIPELITNAILDTALQNLIEHYSKEIIDRPWLESQGPYIASWDLVTTLHQQFKTEAEGKTIPDTFSFSRADSAVLSLSNQLQSIYGRDIIIVPFNLENPRPIHFPNALQGFLDAKSHFEMVSNTGRVFIIAKLVCGIIAVGLIVSGVGAPAGLVLLGIGLGLGTTALGIYEEIGAKPNAFLNCGFAIGSWGKDLYIYPSVMYDAKDFLLTEVDNPFYLNKNNNFNSQLNVYGFPDILHTPWNGKIFEGLFDIQVKNTGNVETDIFLNIDGIWITKKDVSVNQQININNIDFVIPPFKLSDLFVPRQLKIEAYSGVSIHPKESITKHYQIIPSSTLRSDGYLSLSTDKKQLTIDEYMDLLSTESSLIDDYLCVVNPYFEVNFTVGNDIRSVDFYLSYPIGTPVTLSVFDQQGKRIGNNFSTGGIDVQFIGSYNGLKNNPQIITIPDAAGETFTVLVQLDMMYSDDETYHVKLDAFETPFRAVVLGVSPEEVVLTAATGTNISVPVMLGEIGGYEPLFNVSAGITDLEYEGVVLSCVSDPLVDIGLMLPGTDSVASFVFEIPGDAPEGEYIGMITVDAGNAVSLDVLVRIQVSNPPEQPMMPSGPSIGVEQKSYTYETVSVDPEGGPVYYKWSWGDGRGTDWLGPFYSGATATASYMWQDEGKYEVRVLAKDQYGLVSDSSDALLVHIINESILTTALFIGLVRNLERGDDFSSFNVEILLLVELSPFYVDLYLNIHNEVFVVSNEYIGILLPNFVIGRFNFMMGSESPSMIRHPSLRDRFFNRRKWNPLNQ